MGNFFPDSGKGGEFNIFHNQFIYLEKALKENINTKETSDDSL